jgi:hypothetical protein
MIGRRVRTGGAVLAVALGLVTPVLATAAPSPASADTVVEGCTIVSNPTPTHFTDCSNWNSTGASLDGVDLEYADLAGATFDSCTAAESPQAPTCVGSDFIDADLSHANLTGATFAACAVSQPEPVVGCALSNLTEANLTDADLTNASFSPVDSILPPNVAGATLTGANFTGTILVPPNQSVTATSQAGAVATWSTPAGIPGATPGSCTPPSGSTFPLFTSTVTCQVLDIGGDVATGTFTVTVEPTTQYFTSVLVPSNGATLAGRSYLDAAAGDGPGVKTVRFELSGGPSDLSDPVIATATPTIVGWLAAWDSASVFNGSYTLQSVATDADAHTDTSTAVSLTVDNPTPTTTVVLPAGGATLKGSQYLDATASANASVVTYELSGGPSDLSDHVIATATLTYIGWAAAWNTASVPDGSYTLGSVASYSGGVSGTSPPVTIMVDN